MKTKFTTLIVLALVITSCSVESPDEPLIEIGETEQSHIRSADKLNFDFTIWGEFEIVKPQLCDGLEQLKMKGFGKSENLKEEFMSKATYCTDFSSYDKMIGFYEMLSGDKLFYYSNESGWDAMGKWMIFIFNGGTGKYVKAHGKVKVYSSMDFISATKGLYKSEGQGYLVY